MCSDAGRPCAPCLKYHAGIIAARAVKGELFDLTPECTYDDNSGMIYYSNVNVITNEFGCGTESTLWQVLPISTTIPQLHPRRTDTIMVTDLMSYRPMSPDHHIQQEATRQARRLLHPVQGLGLVLYLAHSSYQMGECFLVSLKRLPRTSTVTRSTRLGR